MAANSLLDIAKESAATSSPGDRTELPSSPYPTITSDQATDLTFHEARIIHIAQTVQKAQTIQENGNHDVGPEQGEKAKGKLHSDEPLNMLRG